VDRTSGSVYLIGAGPGAPDLLTVRAARLLAQAQIVFHDALVHPDTLSWAPNAVKVAVGKRCGRHSTAQKFINKRLIDAARKYTTVVRLKGGDPMMFGRAQEEIDALIHAGVQCEVVPGITAALAAAAQLSTSLTRRGVSRNVAFVTPRAGDGEVRGNWLKAVCNADTSVLYMAAGEAGSIAVAAIRGGLAPDTPVVIMENVSLGNERKVATTLGRLSVDSARAATDGPALLMIGRVFESVASSHGVSAGVDAGGARPAIRSA